MTSLVDRKIFLVETALSENSNLSVRIRIHLTSLPISLWFASTSSSFEHIPFSNAITKKTVDRSPMVIIEMKIIIFSSHREWYFKLTSILPTTK